MSHYLLMCKSLTYAQRTARVLERYGISSGIIKAPQGLNPAGCAHCVKITDRHFADAMRALSAAEVYPSRIFIEDDSAIREVWQ